MKTIDAQQSANGIRNQSFYLFFLLVLFLTSSSSLLFTASAQGYKQTLDGLYTTDSADIHTLAMYPDSVRQQIFLAAAHPEGITRLNDVRSRTNDSFRKLLEPFSRDEQDKIWELTRYDKLISRLVKEGDGKPKKIETVLKDYPASVHDNAKEYAWHHRELLDGIDHLQKDFDQSVSKSLQEYPPATQDAFHFLLNYPEILTLLNGNMHLAVTLGDIQKNDPALLKQEFDSLSLALALQKTRDLEEWKKTLNENPEAKNELKKSAADYASEKGYRDVQETDPVIVNHYYYHPYPFWCGHPWWYEYDWWYPYPWWYHSGFYVFHGDIIFLGPPSWYFMQWHFYHHPHLYQYPHITNVYINYYYGPRRAVATNGRVVTQWMRDNQRDLPRDFVENKQERIDRIQEFGKLGQSVDDFNKKNPSAPVKRDDFLKNHADEYPHLKPVVEPRIDQPQVSPGKATEPGEIRTGTPEKKPEQALPPVKRQETTPFDRKPETRPGKEKTEPVTPRDNTPIQSLPRYNYSPVKSPPEQRVNPPVKQQPAPRIITPPRRIETPSAPRQQEQKTPVIKGGGNRK